MFAPRRVFPYAIALLSGACALVYEIVWTRVFTPVFGLSVDATTAVLCAFMAGLGIGSGIAPAVIARWNGSLWRLYALLEIGIGVSALLIPFSVAPITLLYLSFSGVDTLAPATAMVRFLLATAPMVIPTLLMGLTLPVLIHAFRNLEVEPHVAARRMGLLYGINTVGGAIGCLLAGFVLLETLGVITTTAVIAGTNFGLAIVVYATLGKRESVPPPDVPAPVEAASPVVSAKPMDRRLILLLYGVIGFTALGYELSWFRILVFYLQSATYSFSIMLTLFLLGMGSGSAFFSAYLERRLDRASADFRSILGGVQLLIALIGAITLPVSTWIPGVWTWLIGGLGAGSWLVIVLQKVIVAALVILPATFLFGVSFPLVARLFKEHGGADSKTVASLYAANTAGAILGSVVTGFVLFDRIGVQHTITVLSLLSAAIGLMFFLRPLFVSQRSRAIAAALTLAVAAALALTPSRLLIANFEKHAGRILFYQESAADISFVHESAGARVLAFGDGRGAAGSGAVGNYANRLLAYSAMMLHPEAKTVLVISMGAGNTASAFAQFPIERLDIVDISAGPFEAAAYFSTNLGVLDDPRVHTWVEDGRNFLLRSQRKYDIIQLELPTLHTAGVVYLYTEEFYEIARSALEEDGLLSQWIDVVQTGRPISYMLINTMLNSFPNAAVWTDNWSWWVTGKKQKDPISIDFPRSRALFANARVKQDLRSVGSSYADTLSKLRAAGESLHNAVAGSERITDDRTLADFLVPRSSSPAAFGGGVGYYTSPLGEAFRSRWALDGDTPVLFRKPRFYVTEQEMSVARSLAEVAAGVPDRVLTRVRKLNAVP